MAKRKRPEATATEASKAPIAKKAKAVTKPSATAPATAAPKSALKTSKSKTVAATPKKVEPEAKKKTKAAPPPAAPPAPVAPKQPSERIIQIVAGSYDRILHGITATIDKNGKTSFADSFLFNAHTAAIRCLALSPMGPTPTEAAAAAAVTGKSPKPTSSASAGKVLLASGSADERINVYSLSAYPPPRSTQEQDAVLSRVAPRPIQENRKNRELGTLLHHSSGVTALRFPTRGKLLSASEDSTIGVTRTRDWTLMSSCRAPVPVAMGRPSGDTAPLGGTPAGVNDFAVHPGLKVMISVSKGERCMRLWNLMTGQKAGVLNFGRDLLREVGEGKFSTGEGRSVVWRCKEEEAGDDEDEDEFAVAFDRDVVVFGMDSVPRCRVMGPAAGRTKVHRVRYVSAPQSAVKNVLAVATEDGRVLFFSTDKKYLSTATTTDSTSPAPIPTAKLVGQLGGLADGVSGRIKDFTVLHDNASGDLDVVAGSSDGRIRVWRIKADALAVTEADAGASPRQLGQLLGTYETQNRITCVEGFVMLARPEGEEEEEEESDDEDGDAEEDSDDSE